MFRRTNTGQQHDLRRANRAGGENDFSATARRSRFAALPPAHAGGAAAVEHYTLHQTTGFEPEIGAIQHRLEEGGRRRPAPAALLIDVKDTAAFVVAGIEVHDGLDVGLLGGGPERIKQIPVHARRLHAQFATDAVRIAFAQEMIFVSLEKRQHIVPAPATQPKLAPMVIIGGLAAHVDHGIDRG